MTPTQGLILGLIGLALLKLGYAWGFADGRRLRLLAHDKSQADVQRALRALLK